MSPVATDDARICGWCRSVMMTTVAGSPTTTVLLAEMSTVRLQAATT
jgi:hypothetical protein